MDTTPGGRTRMMNGCQAAAFAELALLRRLRMRARWMPVEWQVENFVA